MSHLVESKRPELASDPSSPAQKSAGRDKSELFLRKLCANGPHSAHCFRKLCDLGCPRDRFVQLLWATCVFTSSNYGPLLHGGNLTKAQLRALPKKLRDVADMIKTLNATPLGPANESNLAARAPHGSTAQISRDYLILRYEMLPGMLYVYAHHMERFTKIARRSAKRLTIGHITVISLLHFVKKYTGSPRYDDLSELLEQGCRMEGNKQTAPTFLSTEGLAKLYQRWGNAVAVDPPSFPR